MKGKKYLIMLIFMAVTASSFAQRGWNPKTKNAVIGAGAGAVVGALVSKNNRASGALIGGAIGGGAGYLYGRHRAHEQYEARMAARHTRHTYHAQSRPSSPRTNEEDYGQNALMSSQDNAAYGNQQDMAAYNYFRNTSYGYQRKSW